MHHKFLLGLSLLTGLFWVACDVNSSSSSSFLVKPGCYTLQEKRIDPQSLKSYNDGVLTLDSNRTFAWTWIQSEATPGVNCNGFETKGYWTDYYRGSDRILEIQTQWKRDLCQDPEDEWESTSYNEIIAVRKLSTVLELCFENCEKSQNWYRFSKTTCEDL